MNVKNQTTGATLLIIGDLPNYSDKTNDDGQREQDLDPFLTTSQSVKKNDKIRVIDDLNGKTFGDFNVIATYKGEGGVFIKTDTKTSTLPTPGTSTPRVISESYDNDTEKESWDTTIKDNFLQTNDNIASKAGITKNNNEITYNFNDGIISISREL